MPVPNPYPNGVGAYYKELVKSYLGLTGAPLRRSYTFNGYEVGPGDLPRITGKKLAAIPHSTKAVLVGEFTAFFGGSWHPLKRQTYRDAKSVLSFVDGHVGFSKIYWDGVAGSQPRNYEPVGAYDYDWDGE